MIKGEWAGLLTIATTTEVQNKGGGVLRLRNCQAIIDLIKAKRHRLLPYSAAVLHKVGRVKVTQEVGGRRCLPGLPLAMHFGIGKDKHTHTLTEKHSHMFAAKVKGCSTTKAAAALVAQAALHIPRLLLYSLWRYLHQLEQLNYRTIKINQSICKISVPKNNTMKRSRNTFLTNSFSFSICNSSICRVQSNLNLSEWVSELV